MEPSEPIAVRVSTVARLLDLSPNTVLLLCREGKMPGAFKVGRAWRIPLSGIDALTSMKVTSGNADDGRASS